MMSRQARFLEKSFKAIGMRNIVAKTMLNPKRRNRNEELPKSYYKKYRSETRVIHGCKCVTVSKTENSKQHMLYFHGGAYTMQAQKSHWRIVDALLQRTGCSVTFINYPLSPEHTCRDTISMAIEAYSFYCGVGETEIILAGDSAGGGLALSLAQQINCNGIMPKPVKLVLFSPWLDILIQDPISEELEQSDLVLNKEVLKTVGKRYSGDLEPIDSACSPLYGDFTGIGEIALFTGTCEILSVQAKQLRDMLKGSGQDVSYFEYEDMQHAWIAFRIPEAQDALVKAALFINK
jgi:acetyl esterase/lipase